MVVFLLTVDQRHNVSCQNQGKDFKSSLGLNPLWTVWEDSRALLQYYIPEQQCLAEVPPRPHTTTTGPKYSVRSEVQKRAGQTQCLLQRTNISLSTNAQNKKYCLRTVFYYCAIRSVPNITPIVLMLSISRIFHSGFNITYNLLKHWFSFNLFYILFRLHK